MRGAQASQEALQRRQVGKYELLTVDDGACLGVDGLARAEKRDVAGEFEGCVLLVVGVVGRELEGLGLTSAQLNGVGGVDEELSVGSGQGLLVDDVSNFSRQIPKFDQSENNLLTQQPC